MPHFYTEYTKLDQYGSEYQTMKKSLSSAINELAKIEIATCLLSFGYDELKKNLFNALRRIDRNGDELYALGTALTDVAAIYAAVDNRLLKSELESDKVKKYMDAKGRGLFISYTWGGDFTSKLNAVDAALMVFFQQFDISKEQILKLINGQGYKYKQFKDIITETVDEACDTADYTSEIEKMRKALDMLKNGEKVSDFLTPDEYKLLKQFFKGLDVDLDNVSGPLEIADDSIKVLSEMFGDYSKNIEILKSLKNLDAYGNNPVAQQVVDDMLTSYQDKIAGAMKNVTDILVDKGYDTAADALADATPVMAVVKGVDTTIKVVGVVTGGGTYTENLADYCYTTDLRTDATAAFTVAYDKLQSGNYTSQDVTNFENAFAYNKQLAVRQYKLQLDLYKQCNNSGNYNSQIAQTQASLNQLEKMNVNDTSTWVQEDDLYKAGGGGISSGGGGGGSIGGGGGGGFR